MQTAYTLDAAEFAAFSLQGIVDMLELDADFLQVITPSLLRAWLKTAPRLSQMQMKALLTGTRDAADDSTPRTRDGFVTAVTDRTWLATLVNIAGNAMFGDLERLENLEVGFTEALVAKYDADRAAERAARAEAMRHVGDVAAQQVQPEADEGDDEPTLADMTHEAPAPVQQTRQPVHAAEFELEDLPADDLLAGGEQLAQHVEGDALYLPAARATHLTLPHIVMRSPIIAMKPRNAARQQFTTDAPLRIARVSGMRQGTVDMVYVGEELRAADWETFAYILRFAATVPLGARLPSIRVVDMLKAMGRGTSTPDRKSLEQQLARLRNAELQIWTNDVAVVDSWQALFPNEPLFKRGDIPGVRTSFKLLGDIVEAKTEKGNVIEFTTELSRYVRAFFGQKLSTWYSESMYQQLKGDLAKRLFLFYQSHNGRYDFTFDELVDYLGTTSTSREQFRKSLAAAHDELEAACFVKGWAYKASASRNGQRAYVLQGLTAEKKTRANSEEFDL
ncbi:TrfA family protein [Burkholderia pseudomallei]|nr:TrfA family protein [Burkholderia pseudomallei]